MIVLMVHFCGALCFIVGILVLPLYFVMLLICKTWLPRRVASCGSVGKTSGNLTMPKGKGKVDHAPTGYTVGGVLISLS